MSRPVICAIDPGMEGGLVYTDSSLVGGSGFCEEWIMPSEKRLLEHIDLTSGLWHKGTIVAIEDANHTRWGAKGGKKAHASLNRRIGYWVAIAWARGAHVWLVPSASPGWKQTLGIAGFRDEKLIEWANKAGPLLHDLKLENPVKTEHGACAVGIWCYAERLTRLNKKLWPRKAVTVIC